jgi:hypothetical protein
MARLKTFLNMVKDHDMNILLDTDEYRNIRFSRPDTSDYSFSLITWPWHLVITGDLGTYHFSRTEDMFNFFVMPKYDFNRSNVINPGYWSEKLQGDIQHSEFSYELFHEIVEENFNEYVNDNALGEKASELWDELQEQVFDKDIESEHAAYEVALDFTSECCSFSLADFWEYKFTRHKQKYLNCCYAIVWGICKYRNDFSIFDEALTKKEGN